MRLPVPGGKGGSRPQHRAVHHTAGAGHRARTEVRAARTAACAIYSAPSHADAARVKQHLDRFEAVFPESVRAFPDLRWSKDMAVVAQVSARIRRNLKDRTRFRSPGGLRGIVGTGSGAAQVRRAGRKCGAVEAGCGAPVRPRCATQRGVARDAPIPSYSLRTGVDEYAKAAEHEIATRFPIPHPP